MPIYEFYCADCHRVFNFLARAINTAKRPNCPRCGRPELDRKVSRFAISKGRAEPAAEGPADNVDEAALERAMEQFASEAESLDENNPRDMARFFRKISEAAGMPKDERFEEVMRRMEAGEDPDALEEEFGDLFDGESGPLDESEGKPAAAGALRTLVHRIKPPTIDETLYDLE